MPAAPSFMSTLESPVIPLSEIEFDTMFMTGAALIRKIFVVVRPKEMTWFRYVQKSPNRLAA
ncbi:hypothetical protein ABH19_02440 [Leptospirillum sp. Group II 'CF-1']|nr:hypothetical protein ABH19_02440 [Leptospirillum sp. Group II 'CF-1']